MQMNIMFILSLFRIIAKIACFLNRLPLYITKNSVYSYANIKCECCNKHQVIFDKSLICKQPPNVQFTLFFIDKEMQINMKSSVCIFY